MEVSFKAVVVLSLDHRSKHIATDFNLEVDPNLEVSRYLEKELPTKDGSKVLSNVLIQGLIGNIHMAHEKGFRDSAEHLRWIISELERGFVQVTQLTQSNFKG
jgi:hypothetical protein